MPWRPILLEPVRQRALHAAHEVAGALSTREWAPATIGPGLASGNAGLAVFFEEMFRLTDDRHFEETRDARWNFAIDQLGSARISHPSLFGGYCGVGWATAHLSSEQAPKEPMAPPEDPDGIHEDLEETLLQDLETLPSPTVFDLVGGPVGWGLYSLQRWPHARARRALEHVVDFLERTAEPCPEGFRWWTSPYLLQPWQRELSPGGYYNLGLAHGVPGICVLLSQVIRRGIRDSQASRLLEGAVDWMLSQRIEGSRGLAFPSSIIDGQPPDPSRLAWCYGDLGIAAALLVAAHCVGHERWATEALSIARNAARISPGESGIVDTGLCHGSAGAGHVFNRMYQMTHDPLLLDAARFWLERTLDMRVPKGGLAGFVAWMTGPHLPGGVRGWVALPGVLEGAAGSALALLAGCTHHESAWDRFLFLSPVPNA
jgi:lantibiotic biosynthesis protein